MESKAIVRYVRTSPRKVRQVSDLVCGKAINEALTILKFSKQKRIANTLSTLIESAAANATVRGKIDVDNLHIKKLVVDQGPTLKRYASRAKGQGMKVLKKTSHISVVLEER